MDKKDKKKKNDLNKVLLEYFRKVLDDLEKIKNMQYLIDAKIELVPLLKEIDNNRLYE